MHPCLQASANLLSIVYHYYHYYHYYIIDRCFCSIYYYVGVQSLRRQFSLFRDRIRTKHILFDIRQVCLEFEALHICCGNYKHHPVILCIIP